MGSIRVFLDLLEKYRIDFHSISRIILWITENIANTSIISFKTVLMSTQNSYQVNLDAMILKQTSNNCQSFYFKKTFDFLDKPIYFDLFKNIIRHNIQMDT